MSLDNMKVRLGFRGGNTVNDRIIEGKLRSLRYTLRGGGYQRATAVLEDGREFYCLINEDKLSLEKDDKIISIPYEDVCINQPRVGTTTQGRQKVGLKSGDIFQWKETGTYWLVYLHHVEELAYFRGELRKCEYEIEMEGRKQRVYVKGPIQISIDWVTGGASIFNKLNYKIEMLLPKTEENESFFHRFTLVKFKGKTWEVQAVDNISSDQFGVMSVHLKEYYNNELEEQAKKEMEENLPEIIKPEDGSPHIEGPTEIYPFDVVEYSIANAEGGKWYVNTPKVKALKCSDTNITIEIDYGRSFDFVLSYKADGRQDINLPIKVLSL